jgi:zinc transporter ZupT
VDWTLVWIVLPGLATRLGGLGLLARGRAGERLLDVLLGLVGAIVFAAATGRPGRAPATLAGYLVADSVVSVLPAALAFAAGAMIYVVVDEMLPEARERGNEFEATGGFTAGFVVMMVLDNALG